MRYPLVYGTIAGVIIVALSWPFLWTGFIEDEIQGMVFGYLIMVAGLTMTFVGVKRYRDMERGGVIGFGRALAIASGIAGVASIIYVLGTEAYFLTPAGARMVAAIASSMMPNYGDTLNRIWFTLTNEIAPVAVIAALLSAAILSNPRVLPARGWSHVRLP